MNNKNYISEEKKWFSYKNIREEIFSYIKVPDLLNLRSVSKDMNGNVGTYIKSVQDRCMKSVQNRCMKRAQDEYLFVGSNVYKAIEKDKVPICLFNRMAIASDLIPNCVSENEEVKKHITPSLLEQWENVHHKGLTGSKEEEFLFMVEQNANVQFDCLRNKYLKKILEKSTHLEKITLDSIVIPENTFEGLSFDNMKEISLNCASFSGESLRKILIACKNLEKLSLRESHIEKGTFDNLFLEKLKTIDLNIVFSIEKESIESICKACPNLKYVSVVCKSLKKTFLMHNSNLKFF